MYPKGLNVTPSPMPFFKNVSENRKKLYFDLVLIRRDNMVR